MPCIDVFILTQGKGFFGFVVFFLLLTYATLKTVKLCGKQPTPAPEVSISKLSLLKCSSSNITRKNLW